MNKSHDGTGKRSRIKRAFGSSIIFSALDRVSEWIYKKLGSGFFGGIFASYTRCDGAAQNSMVKTLAKKTDIHAKAVTPLKRGIARSSENSRVLGAVRGWLDSLLYGSMKSYGIFMFSFALYSAIAYILHVLYFGDAVVEAGSLTVFAVMLISSVMMIASRHTLASALRTSPFASLLLFKVVGLRKEAFLKDVRNSDRFNIPFIAGLVFGILSFFIKPVILILWIAVALTAYTVLIKPEFGVLVIFAALPFIPTAALAAAVLYTFICFFIKVMRGKRSVKFDLVDGMVLAFMLLMALGGLVCTSESSMHTGLVYAEFMLGYFMVVNLIRLKEWVTKCVGAIILSCTGVALYGLFQGFFGHFEAVRQSMPLLEFEGVVSAFENPSVLAQYLIMVIPLIAAALIVSKAPRIRLLLVCSLAASFGCLIYTWSTGAWLGFAVGIIAFLLLYSRKTLVALVLGGAALSTLPFVLPDGIIQRFNAVTDLGASAAQRTDIWHTVSSMLNKYWVSGIGVGEEAFTRIYSIYSSSAVQTVTDAHNLYLQILVELGIAGLVVFALMLFFWSQSCLTLHMSENRSERFYSSAILCGIAAVLVQAITAYIWHDHRVFLMFWLLMGLACAVRKTLYLSAADDII